MRENITSTVAVTSTVSYLTGEHAIDNCASVLDIKSRLFAKHPKVLPQEIVIVDCVTGKVVESDPIASKMSVLFCEEDRLNPEVWSRAIALFVEMGESSAALLCAAEVLKMDSHFAGVDFIENAKNGNYNVVEAYVRAGICVDTVLNQRTKRGAVANDAQDWYVEVIAMVEAARNGHLPIVDILLEAGARVDRVTRNPNRTSLYTPLIVSAANGHFSVVNALLKAGAQVDGQNWKNSTPLIKSASKGHLAIVSLLLQAGANIEAEDYQGRTPLSKSATNGHLSVVEALIEARADVDGYSCFGFSPLGLSASHGHHSVVNALLKAGAKVDSDGMRTPLVEAARNGHLEIVKTLLKAGANVEADNGIALIESAGGGHHEVVNSLLRAGARVNPDEEAPTTALLNSIYYGHLSVVVTLIQAGANIYVTNGGITPLKLSLERGHVEISDVIQQAHMTRMVE